ncbi:nuclear transport factor 2 family protein [Nocardiopsis potens]|uniref:nuclear transport factor 2 family protein n=1 Tax=Nocardiopsis potens TaxID=1246458 RepID=UPI00034D0EFC|nr:nuclear transport factor 2 family protein [Nocardiopsis potens]
MVDKGDVTDTPPEGRADRAGVVAAADAWAEAITANDPERIAEFMAEGWAIVSETGVGAKRDFLDLVASGELTHSAMERIGEPRVLLLDGVAVYTARVANTAHYRGRRYDADEWTTDVFIRRGGRWVCVHSHITPVAPAWVPEEAPAP